MVNCKFCSKELEAGTGTMFVKNDGSIFYFCAKKCETNHFKLKRKPRDFKWTGTYEKGEVKK
jgi:large subunit ribosomal protein L24e